MLVSVKELIAPHFYNTFNSKKRHQIDKGGRGSTKTSKNALKICLHCLEEKSCSAVIVKRYQNTLRNSVYKEIKRALTRFQLQEDIDYKAFKSPAEIHLNNGNNIYFARAEMITKK